MARHDAVVRKLGIGGRIRITIRPYNFCSFVTGGIPALNFESIKVNRSPRRAP